MNANAWILAGTAPTQTVCTVHLYVLGVNVDFSSVIDFFHTLTWSVSGKFLVQSVGTTMTTLDSK